VLATAVTLVLRFAIGKLRIHTVEPDTLESAGGAVAALLTAQHPERIRGAVLVGHGLAMDPA